MSLSSFDSSTPGCICVSRGGGGEGRFVCWSTFVMLVNGEVGLTITIRFELRRDIRGCFLTVGGWVDG